MYIYAHVESLYLCGSVYVDVYTHPQISVSLCVGDGIYIYMYIYFKLLK